MRAFALLLACLAAAWAASTVVTARAAGTATASCPKGSTWAIIGGRATCLKTGARCQSRYAAQYRKHGYLCARGRLRKRPKSPSGPVYPNVPPSPSGPPTTHVTMPSAAALPSTAVSLALGTKSWTPDIDDLAVTPDGVWVSSGPFRVDAATNAVAGPFSTSDSQDIGAGEGSIWASDYSHDLVRRLDATTGKELATVKLAIGAAPEGVVDFAGSIWVATHHGGTVARIDPATNRVVAKVIVAYPGSSGPQGIAGGLGSVWVDVPNENAVFRIDPARNRIAAIIALPTSISPCGGIAVGQTAVWVTSCLDGTAVARIDPATNKVAAVLDVGGEVIQPAADGDTVWFVTGGDPDNSPNTPGYLVQLRADDTVATRIALGRGFISGGAAVAFGSIWVSDFVHPRVIRIPHP